MKKMNKKGFTIVELVIVIAVIAILSAVMIPTFSGLTKKAKLSAAQQEADAALTAVFTEEDAQLGTDNQYYFYVDGYWFQYVGKTMVDLERAPSLTLAAEDKVYVYGTTDDVTIPENAPIKPAAGVTVTTKALEDIGDVIVYVDVPTPDAD